LKGKRHMANPTAGASNKSRNAAAAKSKGRKRTSSLDEFSEPG
jgi:hypothetical protein